MSASTYPLVHATINDSAGDFDLRVESRFKNAVLYRAVLDKCSGMLLDKRNPGFGRIVATEAGIHIRSYYELLNLKKNPYTKSGSLTSPAQRLVEYLGVPPAELFPRSLYALQFPRMVVREYRSTEIVPLLSCSGASTPDYDLSIDRTQLLDHALQSLAPREERIIRRRFYGEWTREEIAKEDGVTVERIRQIETKALRKLRHPSRSQHLRQVL